MEYSLDQLRQVKGIGEKTIQRIIEQFDESEYVSRYDPSIHIESNSLINGDMLEVMNGIPDNSIDMILTDLPYGITASCSWDNIIPFDKMWKQYNRVIKDNGAIVLFGNEPFSTRLRMSNLENYKYDWKWKKNRGLGFLNVKKMPLRDTEDIMVFYTSPPTYNPQMRHGKPYKSTNGPLKQKETIYRSYNKVTTINSGERYPVTTLEFSQTIQTDHPTHKPVALLEYLIKTYTNEDEVVLDSTMGSGSTCVAAKNTNRKYIGIELYPDYFEIAKKRIDDIK